MSKLEDAAGRVDAVRCKLAAVPQEEAARRQRLHVLQQQFDEAEARLREAQLETGDAEAGDSSAATGKRAALEEARISVEELKRDLLEARTAKEGKRAAAFQANVDLRTANEELTKARKENSETGSEKARRAAVLHVPKLLTEVEQLRKQDGLYKGSVFGPIGADMHIKVSARDRAARAGAAGGRHRGGGEEDGENDNEAASAAAASVVARMLESSVPKSLLTQFVVTDTADHTRVLELARETREASAVALVELGGVLPAGGAGGGRGGGGRIAPKIKMTPELRELGVDCTLGDIIDAPPEIKRVLEDDSGVDSRALVSFLGGGRAPSLEAVRRVCPAAKLLVTPEGVQRCLVSRYNRDTATTILEPLRPRSMLFEDSEGAAAKAKLATVMAEKKEADAKAS